LKARHGKALHVYIGTLRRSRPLFLPTLFLPMRSRSGRPDGGGGGPDGAPSSPSFGRRWRPRRRPFLSLLRPAWRPRRRHGGPGGGGGSGARCGALFLLSQINGGSCPSHTRTLADPRRRWRAAATGAPPRTVASSGVARPARIHGGAAPTRRDGTDPRRGGPNPPRRRGSTAGRRLPPTQSTAAQIRWAWRPPRPFLSLRRCGGLELRRIQSTAVDRRRRRDLGSVRPGSKPVWAFFLFFCLS